LPLSAQTASIQASGAYWVDYVETNDKGIYIDLIKLVYNDDAVHFDIGSFVRAKHMFNAKKSDILIGVYKSDLLDLNDAVLPNYHLDIEFPTVAIFDPK
jgi:hypothetical protein